MSTVLQRGAITRIVNSSRVVEGKGFQVRRPFPTAALMDVDPFLMLDHFGPMDIAPGAAEGVPPHPHRGFETITYMLEGSMAHKDSQGNYGALGPGDVQWMTAGSGVIHSEMPTPEFLRTGGRLQGFQLWVNLPRQDKLVAPNYADVPAARIPTASSPDGSVSVRVLSGTALGVSHELGNRTPITYLHFTLAPGAEWEQTIPGGQTALAYVIEGTGAFGAENQNVSEGQLALFAPGTDSVTLKAQTALSVLLLAGTPFNEPIARYGPFVMNTETEIRQAIRDYQSGQMGYLEE